MEALEHQEVPRHPWLETLVAAPHEAVSDFMAGHAAVSPFTRLNAPDAANRLLGPLSVKDPARLALDEGMKSWLVSKRDAAIPGDKAELQNLVRQICEAFETIEAIDLKRSAVMLHEQYQEWLEWVTPLDLAPSRNALKAFLSMIESTKYKTHTRDATPMEPQTLTGTGSDEQKIRSC
jgi:hypothetical protein